MLVFIEFVPVETNFPRLRKFTILVEKFLFSKFLVKASEVDAMSSLVLISFLLDRCYLKV